ncbi:Maf family protein [Pseudarthrobacter sp. J1763]|uniref:Maf family protein n=1 Tax=Pseudarthrobacter sp. J1763 TaxID=3420445 RepID=UPI003D2DEBB9
MAAGTSPATPVRLILASKSPARAKLLTEAGIYHEILVSEVDEDAAVAAHGPADSAQTALLLARVKALAVAARPEAQGALVLGCDSVFEFEGEAHGKPYTAEVAIERISRMSGKSGVLHTGHWLVDCRDSVQEPAQGKTVQSTIAQGKSVLEDTVPAGAGALSSATVNFVTMLDSEIQAYVATGEPLHCAGSFTIDGLGGAFIAGVEGDPHAVVGLSVSTLRELLTTTGVSLPELWRYTA